MADFWTDPKVDWDDNDGIGYEDLNRIEQNTKAVRDGTYRRVQGFGFLCNNQDPAYDGLVTVKPGSCYSNNGVPIKSTTNITKNLGTWAQGHGVTFGGMAAAVMSGPGVTAYTWYYIFIISNPVTGAVDVQFDNNTAGTNITSITFTEKRIIGAFKTVAAGGHSSFDVLEMWSDGDNTYINPWSYTAATNKPVISTSNLYVEQTLSHSTRGLLLPAVQCEAFLTIITDGYSFGLYSIASLFTTPATFLSGTDWRGEFAYILDDAHQTNETRQAVDLRFLVSSDSKIKVATSNVFTGDGLLIYARGFYWDRLI